MQNRQSAIAAATARRHLAARSFSGRQFVRYMTAGQHMRVATRSILFDQSQRVTCYRVPPSNSRFVNFRPKPRSAHQVEREKAPPARSSPAPPSSLRPLAIRPPGAAQPLIRNRDAIPVRTGFLQRPIDASPQAAAQTSPRSDDPEDRLWRIKAITNDQDDPVTADKYKRQIAELVRLNQTRIEELERKTNESKSRAEVLEAESRDFKGSVREAVDKGLAPLRQLQHDLEQKEKEVLYLTNRTSRLQKAVSDAEANLVTLRHEYENEKTGSSEQLRQITLAEGDLESTRQQLQKSEAKLKEFSPIVAKERQQRALEKRRSDEKQERVKFRGTYEGLRKIFNAVVEAGYEGKDTMTKAMEQVKQQERYLRRFQSTFGAFVKNLEDTMSAPHRLDSRQAGATQLSRVQPQASDRPSTISLGIKYEKVTSAISNNIRDALRINEGQLKSLNVSVEDWSARLGKFQTEAHVARGTTRTLRYRQRFESAEPLHQMVATNMQRALDEDLSNIQEVANAGNEIIGSDNGDFGELAKLMHNTLGLDTTRIQEALRLRTRLALFAWLQLAPSAEQISFHHSNSAARDLRYLMGTFRQDNLRLNLQAKSLLDKFRLKYGPTNVNGIVKKIPPALTEYQSIVWLRRHVQERDGRAASDELELALEAITELKMTVGEEIRSMLNEKVSEATETKTLAPGAKSQPDPAATIPTKVLSASVTSSAPTRGAQRSKVEKMEKNRHLRQTSLVFLRSAIEKGKVRQQKLQNILAKTDLSEQIREHTTKDLGRLQQLQERRHFKLHALEQLVARSLKASGETEDPDLHATEHTVHSDLAAILEAPNTSKAVQEQEDSAVAEPQAYTSPEESTDAANGIAGGDHGQVESSQDSEALRDGAKAPMEEIPESAAAESQQDTITSIKQGVIRSTAHHSETSVSAQKDQPVEEVNADSPAGSPSFRIRKFTSPEAARDHLAQKARSAMPVEPRHTFDRDTNSSKQPAFSNATSAAELESQTAKSSNTHDSEQDGERSGPAALNLLGFARDAIKKLNKTAVGAESPFHAAGRATGDESDTKDSSSTVEGSAHQRRQQRAARIAKSVETSDNSRHEHVDAPPSATGAMFKPTEWRRTHNPAGLLEADRSTAQSLSSMLDYHLSEEALSTAEAQLRGSDLVHWSHLLYVSSQGRPVEVLYCRNREWAQTVASTFLGEAVLGVDIEWEAVPKSFFGDIRDVKNHVSLIQIASESKIALFHVALFQGNAPDELMPAALREILTSESVMKAGVNIGGDARRIKSAFGIDCKGLVELSHTYRLVTYSNDRPELVNRKLVSLSTQVEDVLGCPLRKDDVRMSSWSKLLNREQQHYAAADAYAGFRLYHALEDARLSMTPVPPRPALYEKGETVLLANGQAPPKSRRPASPPADVTDTAQTLTITSEPCDAESVDPDKSGMDAEEAVNDNTGLASSDSRIATVDEWVSQYRAERVKRNIITAKRASLRVYGLWQQHGLSPAELAILLRDPPLKQSTIASYIVEAVAYDKDLPRDPARWKAVRNSVPDYVLKRYKGLATWLSTI